MGLLRALYEGMNAIESLPFEKLHALITGAKTEKQLHKAGAEIKRALPNLDGIRKQRLRKAWLKQKTKISKPKVVRSMADNSRTRKGIVDDSRQATSGTGARLSDRLPIGHEPSVRSKEFRPDLPDNAFEALNKEAENVGLRHTRFGGLASPDILKKHKRLVAMTPAQVRRSEEYLQALKRSSTFNPDDIKGSIKAFPPAKWQNAEIKRLLEEADNKRKAVSRAYEERAGIKEKKHKHEPVIVTLPKRKTVFHAHNGKPPEGHDSGQSAMMHTFSSMKDAAKYASLLSGKGRKISEYVVGKGAKLLKIDDKGLPLHGRGILEALGYSDEKIKRLESKLNGDQLEEFAVNKAKKDHGVHGVVYINKAEGHAPAIAIFDNKHFRRKK